jgi:hypothetical protein
VRRTLSQQEARSKVRRYAGLRILADGRVRLGDSQEQSASGLTFQVNRYRELDDGMAVYDSSNYDISAWHENELYLVMSVKRSRVDYGFFNVALSPRQLRTAVAQLRESGGGLERWIVPALEHTRMQLARGTVARNPEALKAVDALLKNASR